MSIYNSIELVCSKLRAIAKLCNFKRCMASALIVTMTAAQAQMFMAGSPGVSPMGAATYRIPLLLPPGVGGLKPDLALQYNSQSGNGALGVGWSLDGLSAISRCPLTKAQDGAIRGVNMDAGDKFCLDGVRLVLVGGTYGLDSSEYRTEIESFSQIKAFGTAGTGPSYFVVKTKAGLTMEYGVTTDSRIEAQGSSEVRVWALNKVSDAGGNYYTLAYQEENANGDFRLSRIDYTGSIYQGPTNSIQLTYESRSDVGLKYVAGSIVSVTKRLSKVGAYLGQRLVKEYRLSYLGTVAAGKSRLSTVLECDASEACLEPLNIVWSSQNANGPIWQDDSSRTLPFPLSFDNRRGSSGQLIDLNGDGLADMQMSSLLTGYGPAGAGWAGLYASTWINTGTGWTTATSYVTPTYMSTQYQSVSPGVRMADFNGDGLPDILVSQGFMSPPLNKTYLNTGQGWMNVVQNPPPPILAFDSYVPTYYSGIATEDTGAQVIDVNGDGLPDIVIGQLNPGTGVSSRAVWINKNGGWELSPTYVLPVDISIKGTADTGVRLIDINGDGLVDIVKSSPDAIRRTWLNNGQAWTETTSYALPAVLLSDGILRGQLIDVNGDGLPDYIWSFNGFKLTFLNTGRGWQNPVLLKFDGSNWVSTWSWIDWGRATNYTYGFPADLSMSTLADTGTRMVDINGDGLPDIVSSRSVGGVVTNTAWLNTGAGWIQAPDAYKSPGPIAYDGLPDSGVRFQDINGDGLPDYVYSRCLTWDSTYRAKCTQKVDRVSINKTPLDLVVSIVSGAGVSAAGAQFSFASLAMPGLYSKDGISEAYPLVNLTWPIRVISQISKTNGVGGVSTTSYSYGGLKAELGTGRGSLGFRWMKASEQSTGIESYTEYSQVWPYTGLPTKSETRLAGAGNAGVLKRTTTVYECKVPQTAAACAVGVGNRYFVYAASQTEQSWDINGVAQPTIATSSQYGINAGDSQMWGDPTRIDVVTTLGASSATKRTVNVYWPAVTDNGKWITGRLKKATVTSSVQ